MTYQHDARSCGRLGRQTAIEVADRAALCLAEFKKPRAVCLDPEGRVTVESAKNCAEEDLVGVYDPQRGRFELWKQIHDDLAHSAAERGIAPTRVKQRERVYRGRRRKEAA